MAPMVPQVHPGAWLSSVMSDTPTKAHPLPAWPDRRQFPALASVASGVGGLFDITVAEN